MVDIGLAIVSLGLASAFVVVAGVLFVVGIARSLGMLP